MKSMFSGIGTSLISPLQRIGIGQAIEKDRRETTANAAPQISIAGVPGETDPHKFLTTPFQDMVPVHSGTGNSLVGSLAISPDKHLWRDYKTRFHESLFVGAGEGGPPGMVTFPLDESTGEFVRKEEEDFTGRGRLAVPPTRAVVTNRTSAGVFSVRLAQDTDIY
jgi:hypothetical protein